MTLNILLVLGLGSFLAGCADESAQPVHEEHQRLVQFSTASNATIRDEHPFAQIGLLVDAPTANFEYRIPGQQDWIPVEVTWSEGVHHVARVIFDEPTSEVELRNDTSWVFANVELYEHVVASEVLARDLPLEEPAPVLINGVAPADLVIPRAAWGARNPSKICGSVVAPYRMAVHHTASPDSDGGDPAARMRQMQAYHIDSNGWCDIGYHFVVSQSGKIFQARSDERRPGAHVANQNSGNVGISLIGNFQSQTPSETQLAATAKIMGWVGRTYDIPFNRTSIKGHREHAGQGTSCPGDNMIAKLDDLISRASGATPVQETWEAEFQVRLLGEQTDLYTSGSSEGIPDYFPGDTLQAEIVLKNANSSPIRNVQLGYWFETPHLKATNYKIESDAPGFDGSTFALNDSNDNPDNPAKSAMGDEGKLGLYAMGGGETKRIVIDLEVGAYSIGAADHPDVRGWLAHVDGLYGEQDAFNMEPTNSNSFEEMIQGYAQLDVLSRQEWQFDAGEAEQVEGWTSSAPIAVNPELGTLSAELGASDVLESPVWTSIDAATYDQIVLRASTSGEKHDVALYWIGAGEEYGEERAVVFEFDPAAANHVIPVGEHEAWTGEITGLRLVPFLEGSGTIDVDAVFVQSTSGAVGSEREALVTDPPVTIATDEAPKPTVDPKDTGTSGEDKDVDANGFDVDPDDIRVNKGCSTTATAAPGTWMLLAFGFVAMRLRRRR